MTEKKEQEEAAESIDFIRRKIMDDIEAGKNGGKVHTRFPPEPNGYLHIGHAKSICLNFGIAKDFDGVCNLRFDDTNPVKEDERYVEAIKRDVRWLGFDWEDRLFHASDFFQQMHDYAVDLIKAGKAYVCSLTPEETREYRGTLTEPGKESPTRNRSVEENLDLFTRMRNGEFKDGEYLLRAKIDMASPNMNLRDPAIYRIRHETHQMTGDTWCIYPMYDFAHCLSDALEGITHSLCTLEFEDHRPLYDWFINELDVPSKPEQTEFARLNISHTVLSKRKLIQLVENGHTDGWDDPRMPTIAGLRRRGYTPESIRDFCDRIGIAKADNTVVDPALLDFCLREDLNKHAARAMAVLNPLKVVIENFPDGEVEELEVSNNPDDETAGKRSIPFSKELYIEREDFMEDPPKKYFRLSPGREVRLMKAYYVTCTDVVKDPDSGEVVEVRCTYDPATKGGWSEDGRKVKGTLHWVSAAHAVDAEVRIYDRLFTEENPNDAPEGKTFEDFINPEALVVVKDCKVEPSLKDAEPETRFQFLRSGYFNVDPVDSKPGAPVFNRVTGLRDSWARAKRNM